MESPPLPPLLPVGQPTGAAGSSPIDDNPTLPLRLPFPRFPWPTFHYIKGGCWMLNYEPAGTATVRFDGTLRVENHAAGEAVTGRTASGDLYRRPIIMVPIPTLPGQPRFPVPLPPPNPANGIPVQARNKYTYYIRVTKIDEGISLGNTFTMELEFFRFSMTNPNLFTFTQEPAGDTYTATMKWGTAPPGYPSPNDYAEGDVKSTKTGQLAGRLRMGWLSQYYRKCTLEIDTVSDTPPPLQNSGSPTAENWKTVFDRVGYEFTHIVSQRDISDLVEGSWDPAELHAAMTTNREAGVSLDTEWRFYMLVVKNFTNPGLFGVMFDSNNGGPDGTDPNTIPREGLAISAKKMLDNNPGWGASNMGREFGMAASPYFRTACHELGHAFGLYHTEADHSFLARTVKILGDSTAAAPFDAQITWNYRQLDLKRLRHFPDVFIRPGGVEFGRQNDTFPPITPDDLALDIPGLELTVSPLHTDVPLGAPVRVEVTVTNNGQELVQVPKNIGLSSPFTSGTVTDSSGSSRPFRPMVCYDIAEEMVSLAEGDKVTASLTLLGGPNGPLFPSSGLNVVTARVSWPLATRGEGGEALVSLSASAAVLVTPPLNPSHAKAAHSILTTPSVTSVLVLGGHHMKKGIGAIQNALHDNTLGRHYACVEARRLATKFMTHLADAEAAAKVLEGVQGEVVMSRAEAKKLEKLGVKTIKMEDL